MNTRFRRTLRTAALLAAVACPLQAQRPTAAEARELLRSRPELVAQLRQRIATSGLSAQQIRARLRAEGYPETLLDAYLPGGSSASDTSRAEDVFSAVQSLAISDSADIADLRDQFLFTPSDTILSAADSADSMRVRGAAARPRVSPRADPDSGFAVFGQDLFATSTNQFEANQAGPVDASYRLGPGDRLVLILTGDVEAAHALEVTREGFIVIPQVGQIDVANLTMAQLEDVLYARLGRVYSGVRRGPGATTRFSVSVARLRSNQVFVVGDVRRPGSYRVSSAGTALSALYAAGGATPNGSLRRVEIRRAAKLLDTLDVYDYLLRGDASHDVRLGMGDIVFVPSRGAQVRVVGEVLRPATYELKPGERLGDVIRMAGGFAATASRGRLQIERILAPALRQPGKDRVVIDVTEPSASSSALMLPLEPGDVVRVFPVATRIRNRVTVRGNVWSPGPQGVTDGMTLSQVIARAGGPKPDVYLGQILVSRLQPDSTRIQLRARFKDSTGAVLDDFPVREDDEIQVFSVSNFRPSRFVAITGAIRKGGGFPYREGMTLRDLVLQAGGLDESAYLGEAEIARLPSDRSTGQTAITFRVPLDSSYLFDRDPNGKYSGPPGLPALSSSAPEVVLKPYDNVLILRQPNWELQRTVYVGGEVRFPGQYSLLNKTERLRAILRRAGGLTVEAYPEGVVFFRKAGNVGRIGVDLPRVLKDERNIDNLILHDGDSIVVPRFNAVVNVNGAVNSQVALAHVPGQNINFYIRAAGGGNKRADLARAYVIQPNGKVESITHRGLLPDGVPRPRPGSFVFVPEKDPADRKDYTAAAAAVAQILASLVAIIVVVAR